MICENPSLPNLIHIYLSICLSVCLSIYLPIYLSSFPFAPMSLFLFASFAFSLYLFLDLYLSELSTLRHPITIHFHHAHFIAFPQNGWLINM